MDFDYNVCVKISPPVLRRGKRVKLTAIISNATKEIAYCVGEIKGYNMRQRLEPTVNNTYTVTIGIPFITPRGIYRVAVYAVSRDMQRGPVFETEVKIV